MSVRGRVIIFSPLSLSLSLNRKKKFLVFSRSSVQNNKKVLTEKMTDLEKQDPVETARLTTGEESNECYTKDELLSK